MTVEESLASEITEAVEQVTAEGATEETTETTTEESKADGGTSGGEGDAKVDDEAGAGSDSEEAAGSVESGDGPGDEEEADEGGEGDKGDGATTAPEPPVSRVSDYVLTRAVRAGLTLEDARQFGNDEALLRIVDRIEAAQKTETKQATETEEDPFAKLPKLDPEVYEPEVIKTFEALTEIVKKQQEEIRSFRSHQENTNTAAQQAQAREVEQWFDKQVESLGEEFQDALGSGGYSTLDRGSSQFANRDKIANQMAVLLAGYQAAGQQAPPRDEVFGAAAKLVLADQFDKAREKKLASELAKRSKQHISRASGQKTKKTISPLDETAALLDAKFFGKG